MSETIESTLYNADRSRRLSVVKRRDGLFCLREELRLVGPDGQDDWATMYTRPGLYDTVETALREAPFEVTWLEGNR